MSSLWQPPNDPSNGRLKTLRIITTADSKDATILTRMKHILNSQLNKPVPMAKADVYTNFLIRFLDRCNVLVACANDYNEGDPAWADYNDIPKMEEGQQGAYVIVAVRDKPLPGQKNDKQTNCHVTGIKVRCDHPVYFCILPTAFLFPHTSIVASYLKVPPPPTSGPVYVKVVDKLEWVQREHSQHLMIQQRIKTIVSRLYDQSSDYFHNPIPMDSPCYTHGMRRNMLTTRSIVYEQDGEIGANIRRGTFAFSSVPMTLMGGLLCNGDQLPSLDHLSNDERANVEGAIAAVHQATTLSQFMTDGCQPLMEHVFSMMRLTIAEPLRTEFLMKIRKNPEEITCSVCHNHYEILPENARRGRGRVQFYQPLNAGDNYDYTTHCSCNQVMNICSECSPEAPEICTQCEKLVEDTTTAYTRL